jgi:uncharacterized phage protein gp47/JayE
MSFGVTAAGFVAKRLADIKSELEAAYKSTFGAGINLEPQSVFGQQIGIHSEREAAIWELAELVYNSRYPDTAEGASLDNVASITNVARLAATYSRVTATITGTVGVTIPVGFVASVVGDATARFATQEEYEIGGGGTVDAVMVAEETGPVQAATGTLTIIETPVTGVASITNALDAVLGRDTETDTQLRVRRLISLNRPGTATIDGIRNAVLQVADVVQVAVIENSTDTVDGDGRPPHSFEAVVSGGIDADVAAAIFSAKSAGIATYGTEDKTVTDSQGFEHTVYFSRPVEVPVYLRATITTNTDSYEGAVYPATGDDAVAAAILAFAVANYVLGHDVVLSQFYTPINTVEGVFGIEMEVSLNGSDWQSTNLSIAANELATFDSSRITVVSS